MNAVVLHDLYHDNNSELGLNCKQIKHGCGCINYKKTTGDKKNRTFINCVSVSFVQRYKMLQNRTCKIMANLNSSDLNSSNSYTMQSNSLRSVYIKRLSQIDE